ncbi:MAG TPA: pantoate--beta-alanine ligase [Verrucomicrobiae bacterium]|nr:pantoate--beta-alanine ligase [Verrucomicrobiae bacterium]
MRVIRSAARMQSFARGCKRRGLRIAFVPTMGALHAGHLSLIRRARSAADVVVVSIYVNPTQFGPREDLAAYPRTFRRDATACRRLGADVLFAPAGLYAADHSTWVEETQQSRGRCGTSRPTHFRGVTTVVAKLFNIVLPDVAVFGQKDAQQCDVIARMIRDLHFPVRLIISPTTREPDGLAMSSRNRYITPAERARAPHFHRALAAAAKLGPSRAATEARRLLKRQGFRVDYAEVANGRLCAAIFLGKARLIDNVPVKGARSKSADDG